MPTQAPRGPLAKFWSFTLNNYTQADLDRLCSPLDGVEYLIFGKEVGASGTPHLQGTVCFQSRKRLTQCITLLGQAHFSPTRYLTQSIEYCKKDGDFFEAGVVPVVNAKGSRNGVRSDIEEFKASVKDGVTSLKDIRELHSEVAAKYPRFVESYIADNREPIVVERHPLRPWQATLYERLRLRPDKREIIFVVDLVGNKGKSWFARYYCDIHDDAQIIVPGKKADMSFWTRDDCTTYFLDCPRSKQGEFIQYDFLEELKNGYIFSPKYESKVKKINTPHVIVLMNEMPCMDKLSMDRYNIVTLN